MVPPNCLLFCDAILSMTPNLSKSLCCSGEWHLEKLKEDGLLLSPHGDGETRTAAGDDSEKHPSVNPWRFGPGGDTTGPHGGDSLKGRVTPHG